MLSHAPLVLGLLGSAAVSMTLPTADASSISDQHTSLLPRAGEPMFTLGYAKCQTTTFFGGQLVTGEREDVFVANGNIDVGCSNHSGSKLGVGSKLGYMEWFQHPTCGMTLNFQPKNGNFDIYQDGHYDLLGTCYPHDGRSSFCPSLLNGGTCEVKTMFFCLWSGKNPRPCA